jgi:hypothetical protein
MAKIGKYGKIIFEDKEIQFIIDNFQTMTNEQIAIELGLKKTIVRMKAYELGLQRMELEYWPDEAVKYLKANYHKIGDLELCRYFATAFPKQKGWTSRHIQKKMSQLGLKRNKLHWYSIKERNRDNGSFGKKNLKNNPKPPKVFFNLNQKTRIELKPWQTVEQLKEKYQNLN